MALAARTAARAGSHATMGFVVVQPRRARPHARVVATRSVAAGSGPSWTRAVPAAALAPSVRRSVSLARRANAPARLRPATPRPAAAAATRAESAAPEPRTPRAEARGTPARTARRKVVLAANQARTARSCPRAARPRVRVAAVT